jgi:hypothetical protein
MRAVGAALGAPRRGLVQEGARAAGEWIVPKGVATMRRGGGASEHAAPMLRWSRALGAGSVQSAGY